MAYATTDDGVRLRGDGRGRADRVRARVRRRPRSWEPQMLFFGRRHRCIAYAARGYPPRTCRSGSSYSQKRAAADIRAVMAGAGIERAHVVGLSMGAFATLHFGLDYPEQALSLVAAGVGYGAEKTREAEFRQGAELAARGFETRGSSAFAEVYASSAARVQFEAKDPAAGASSSTSWRSIRRWGPPTRCAACRRAAVAVRPRGTVQAARAADPDRRRRRGRQQPAAQPVPEADHPGLWPSGPAQDRAHHQSRGARSVQPGGRRFPRSGRCRSLAAARPARPADEILKVVRPTVKSRSVTVRRHAPA